MQVSAPLSVVRGNEVTITATPLDASGNPTTPASVTLYIVYTVSGTPTTDTIDMTLSSSTWSGTWDSSPAQAGTVYWSIKALSPEAAQDGQFQLTANPANS